MAKALPKEHLNLHSLDLNRDDITEIIRKLNQNFKEIAEAGGGPQGPPGKQGEPGCSGKQGNPGRPGDPADYDFRGAIAVGCDDLDVHPVESVVLPISTDFTFLLTNISEDDAGLHSREIGSADIAIERVSTELADFRLKIYDSNSVGTGSHVHLANSLAMVSNDDWFCKSGFTVQVDWNGGAQEYLRIIAQRNPEITGQFQGVDIQSDIVQLRRDTDAQRWILESGDYDSAFALTTEVTDLTATRLQTKADKSGYESLWVDTLEHGEDWEVIEVEDIIFTHSTYWRNDQATAVSEQFWNSFSDNSFIRFKRNNNWVLVDFHLGIDRIRSHDKFYLRNAQIKVNKSILGCKTDGWHPTTILQNEDAQLTNPSESIAEHGFFKLSPSGFTSEGDTFIINLRFLGGKEGVLFNAGSIEGYWVTGQVWATWDMTSCDAIQIEVGESCPTFEILTTNRNLGDCPPLPPFYAAPEATTSTGECAPAPPFFPAPSAIRRCIPIGGSINFPAAFVNPTFHAVRLDDPNPGCPLPTTELWATVSGAYTPALTITVVGSPCGPVLPVFYYAGRMHVTVLPDDNNCPLLPVAVPFVIKNGYDYFFPTSERYSPFSMGDDRFYKWLYVRRRMVQNDPHLMGGADGFFKQL